MRLPDSERSRAVLIGTASYEDGSGFDQLPAVETNIALLSGILRDRTGIAERNIHTLLNPVDQRAIRAALRPAVDEAEDLLLFYFAGHGVWVPDSVGLTHSSSEFRDPEWSTLRFELVKNMLRESAASVKVAILDCCHSGNALKHAMAAEDPGLVLLDVSRVEGSFVLTATDGKRRWADARGTNGCTAFTGTLVDILRSSRSGDPEFMTMNVIYQRLQASHQGRNLPLPHASGRNSGESIALAWNRHDIHRAPGAILEHGRVFAGYEILSKVGGGGMSSVYAARDRDGLPRTVALKLVAGSSKLDREARNRFLREAEYNAMLDHPNILTVLARGEEAGQLWMSMPFVHGESVGSILRRERQIAPARAVRIVTEIASALDYAHQKRVLHLDVKSENIILRETNPEQALLVDFGIAAFLDDQNKSSPNLYATLSYAAPERMNGGHVDRRADCFSLGCVFFEMLTGELPYWGTSPYKLVSDYLPVPSVRNAQHLKVFDSVIASALANDPADRFSSCGALADAAREALRALPTDAQ